MKRLLCLCILIAMLITSLTGCNPRKEQDAQTKYKDTIVFCNGNDISTLDGTIGQHERAVYLTNHIFDPLFTFNAEGEIVPCLALGYEWQDDFTTLKIDIRKGVKFHDGSDMNAEDVKFSFDLMNEHGLTVAGNYDGTEIVDDHTVLLHLKHPYPALMNALSVNWSCIVPSDAYDPKKFAISPIGTGPYKIGKYVEGDYYTLERFDEYWGEPAKTKYITLRIVPEASQRAILLETGEVDAAYALSFNDLDRLKNNPDFKILSSSSAKVVGLDLNCASKGPVGNAKVRQALECAIDKESIVSFLLDGYAEAAKSPVSPISTDYREIAANEYNPELAKKLLKEAGYENEISLKLFTNADQTNREVAVVIQDYLKQVGITLHVVIQDDNAIWTMVENGEDYDMILDFFQVPEKHADLFFAYFLKTGSASNYARYFSPEFEQLYSKYSITPEGEEREALLKQLYMITGRDVPMIGIYVEKKIIACTSKLEGLYPDPGGAHEYQNATVRK